MKTTVKITFSDHGTTIVCIQDGKGVDMEDPRNIQNVAGMVVDVSRSLIKASMGMMKYCNERNYETLESNS